jgi:7-carboxy-7-deazaguanine synthase
MAERSTVDEVISFWEPGLLDLKANQANHEYVGQFCIENGFKLNLQQHLYASLA